MSHVDITHVRNFCIIAHIDHGKSTLADRLLEVTGTVSPRELRAQLLDDMELERDRGITIKARAVALRYEHGGETYELNLVDTPGHVDFHYEVSRSLACCEGALLLVDAAQGVEAQTVANAFAAMEHDLAIIPVLNKVDLQNARVEEVTEEMEHSLAVDVADVIPASAKTGLGIEAVLEAVVDRVPAPTGDRDAPLQAMVFDANYDEFRGAVTYVRLMNGTVRKGQKIKFLKAGTEHDVVELGQFVPQRQPCDELRAGQVGYLICNIKSARPRTHRRHGERARRRGRDAVARLRRAATDGPTAACIRPTARTSKSSAIRSTSSPSMTPASSSSRRPATRWDSASAAGSSACCTWRSFSSGWNARPTSTSCRRRRR